MPVRLRPLIGRTNLSLLSSPLTRVPPIHPTPCTVVGMRFFLAPVRCDAPHAMPVDRGNAGNVNVPVVVETIPPPRTPHPAQAIQTRPCTFLFVQIIQSLCIDHARPDPPGRLRAQHDDEPHANRDRERYNNGRWRFLDFIHDYPFTTGLGLASVLGLGFTGWRLYQSYQACRPLVRGAENAGRNRHDDIRHRDHARVPGPQAEPRRVGDYRPPPPGRYPTPPPAYGLVERDMAAGVREQRRRGVHDELNARQRPAPAVVGLSARHARQRAAAREVEEGTEYGSNGSGDVDDFHSYHEDIQRFHLWHQAEFREIRAMVSDLPPQAVLSC